MLIPKIIFFCIFFDHIFTNFYTLFPSQPRVYLFIYLFIRFLVELWVLRLPLLLLSRLRQRCCCGLRGPLLRGLTTPIKLVVERGMEKQTQDTSTTRHRRLELSLLLQKLVNFHPLEKENRTSHEYT